MVLLQCPSLIVSKAAGSYNSFGSCQYPLPAFRWPLSSMPYLKVMYVHLWRQFLHTGVLQCTFSYQHQNSNAERTTCCVLHCIVVSSLILISNVRAVSIKWQKSVCACLCSQSEQAFLPHHEAEVRKSTAQGCCPSTHSPVVRALRCIHLYVACTYGNERAVRMHTDCRKSLKLLIC